MSVKRKNPDEVTALNDAFSSNIFSVVSEVIQPTHESFQARLKAAESCIGEMKSELKKTKGAYRHYKRIEARCIKNNDREEAIMNNTIKTLYQKRMNIMTHKILNAMDLLNRCKDAQTNTKFTDALKMFYNVLSSENGQTKNDELSELTNDLTLETRKTTKREAILVHPISDDLTGINKLNEDGEGEVDRVFEMRDIGALLDELPDVTGMKSPPTAPQSGVDQYQHHSRLPPPQRNAPNNNSNNNNGRGGKRGGRGGGSGGGGGGGGGAGGIAVPLQSSAPVTPRSHSKSRTNYHTPSITRGGGAEDDIDNYADFLGLPKVSTHDISSEQHQTFTRSSSSSSTSTASTAATPLDLDLGDGDYAEEEEESEELLVTNRVLVSPTSSKVTIATKSKEKSRGRKRDKSPTKSTSSAKKQQKKHRHKQQLKEEDSDKSIMYEDGKAKGDNEDQLLLEAL